jgi:hypothetical protein
MGVVQAAQSIAIVHKGVDYLVVEGQNYDDSHPLVRDHPGLFREIVPDVGPVEQETRAPGEKRAQRKRKK